MELLKVAAWHLDNHEYPLAELLCRQGLKVLGPSPLFSRLLGIALLRQRKNAEAVPHLKAALEAIPDPDLAEVALPCFFAAGEWEGVVKACSKDVLARQPLDLALKIMAMVGTAYFKLGRKDMAAAQFRLCLDPVVSAGALTRGLSRSVIETLIQAAIGANDTALVGRIAALHTPTPDGSARTMGIAPVASLRDWCARERAPVRIVDAEQYVALPPTGYTARDCWTATLPRATVVGGWDFPVAATHEVLEGGNYLPLTMIPGSNPHFHFEELNAVAYGWPETCVDVDADALFLSAPEGMHFGHWLVDFLPRLRAWKRPMKIAIPAALPAKHRETLACFDVAADDLVECEHGKRYRFRTLTVVVTGNHKQPQPANLKFVYKGLAAPPAPKARRIFVHRAAGTRRIANQAEFAALLAVYGFEEVDLAVMSIADQRRMMAETETVLGAHGSDLFCMYMTPPGADVIELVWDGIEDVVFARTAAILGMRHHLLRCPAAPETVRKVYKKDRDIVVDCKELGERLDAIIELRKMTMSRVR